jgi:ubiquitin-conjugating enzyme E2 variant
VIQPNILHHTDQQAFCRGNYLQRNWTVFAVALPLAGLRRWRGWDFLALVLVFTSQANELHCWAHMRSNRVIRALQYYGLLQSPQHHAIHHRRPFDRYYCVMTSFANPALAKIRFWQILESLLGFLGIHPRPERADA